MNIADDQDIVQSPCVTTDRDTILHELDLGRHILCIMSDGSIDLFATEEQTPDLAETGLHLDSEETYRLFISLHEQLKRQDVCH
jgi:hypothetical protein